MRTTVTLDSDVELRLQQLMRSRSLTFKEAINSALRTGLGITRSADVVFDVFDLGEPLVDMTHASRLAAALEDEEIARKLAVGR
ncbi:antitoxin [Mycobacterium sp.]|uniref:antitoxin n=1 Tax=Mycobacterium sp. TaxID=1785 RepID=UPI003D0992B2